MPIHADPHTRTAQGLKETASTVSAMKDANKALKKQFKVSNQSIISGHQPDMGPMHRARSEEIHTHTCMCMFMCMRMCMYTSPPPLPSTPSL